MSRKLLLSRQLIFYHGPLLSQNVFEAARLAGVKQVIYASGSGMFGDDASRVFTEKDFSPAPTLDLLGKQDCRRGAPECLLPDVWAQGLLISLRECRLDPTKRMGLLTTS